MKTKWPIQGITPISMSKVERMFSRFRGFLMFGQYIWSVNKERKREREGGQELIKDQTTRRCVYTSGFGLTGVQEGIFASISGFIDCIK
jgi:hypothetical protein